MEHLTSDNYNTTTKGNVVLVDFFADWCGPCQAMMPTVEELAKKAEGFKVVKVNIDEESELAQKFGVMSIPTFIVLKDGEKVEESIGGGKTEEDLQALVEKHL